MPRFSPCGFFEPSWCLIPTPVLTSEYLIRAVCVCVCVYTHLHPHALPPALKIQKTQTTPLSIPLSKNTPPYQTSSDKIDYKRIFTSCSEFLPNVCANVHSTCLMYTPAHAWCLKHQSKCMHTLREKCISVRACAHMQWCRNFCVMKTCELIFILAPASCRLLFTIHPPADTMK